MATVIPLSQSSFSAKRAKTPPPRQPNQASRTREHLTPDEVERLIIAARQIGGRLAERDALLIMMAYRHGLRASELAGLRRDQINLKAGTFTRCVSQKWLALHSSSARTGAARPPLVETPTKRAGAVRVYFTPRRADDQPVHYLVAKTGKAAEIDFPVHPAPAPSRDRLLPC
jgi:integrase